MAAEGSLGGRYKIRFAFSVNAVLPEIRAACNLADVLRKLGLVLAALALFSIAGGHWAVLQTVAWAEMLHDYSQRTGSLAAAVEQTFDGQHPCALCREIANARSKDQREKPAVSGAKDDAKVKATLTDGEFRPRPPASPLLSLKSAAAPFGPERTEPPPTPPPRRGTRAA